MKMNRKRCAVALGLALAVCGEAGAEEKAVQLGDVVVTATRTEHDAASAPGSVAVVTKEEIEKRPITTVDEAINMMPGVITTRGKGMMDRMSAITLRGIPGQSRTLIMLDGITLNSPYSGTVLSLGISPGSLERIEVLKGPASSLYGGYAMGGVVNMITKMPEKRGVLLQGGFGGGVDSRNGLDNSQKVRGEYGDRFFNRLSVYLNNEYTAADGYKSDSNIQSSVPQNSVTTGTGARRRTTITPYYGWEPTTDYTGSARYIIGDKGQNGAWQNNLTFKTELEINPETRIRFTFLNSTGEYSYNDPSTLLYDQYGNKVWSYGTVRTASFLPGNGGSNQYIYNLAAETVLAKTKFKLNLGYLDQAKSWGVTPTTAAPPNGATLAGGPGKLSDTPAGAVSVDLQASIPVMERHLVTVGGAYRNGWSHTREHNLVNWKDEDSTTTMTYESKGEDRTFALFAEGEFALLDNLTLFAGFRQDWWDTSDGFANQVGSAGYPKSYSNRNATAFSPKGSVVYRPFEVTTLKVSGGKAFRAPTVYDLYRTWTTSGGVTYAGNPNLQPETTLSWDIGITQQLWPGAKGTATYFENYINDLIYSTSTTPTWKDKANAGRATSKGVELELEQRFGKMLRLFANFTYTDAIIRENSAAPASVGKRMTDVPKQMANIGADFEYGPFGMMATGRYVGKRYSTDNNSDIVSGVQGSYDPFFTADLKLRYKITPWATASFSITNLLDRQYYSYSLAPGRSCFGELTLKF